MKEESKINKLSDTNANKAFKEKKGKKNMDINHFTVPRRTAWFVLKTVLLITIIVTLAMFVFLEMMGAANIYILVTEGMELRTSCILGQNDQNEMTQYFTEGFIDADDALNDNVYDYYDISGYDYRLNVDKLSYRPWNSTATMTVTQRVLSIAGNANVDAPTDAVPIWQGEQYKVVCLKENNRWYITKIVLIKEVADEEPNATPNMDLPIITPDVTPTAAPTPTLAPSTSPTTKP